MSGMSATRYNVQTPPPPGASERGSVLISVIITLIMLQIVVMGMVVLASRDSSLSKLRLENAQAEAAAIAGADMALKEIYDNVDLDGDGGIGTISNDGNAANDPTVNFAQVTVVPLAAPSGQRFGVQARAGSTRVWYELSVDQASAPIEGFESYAVGLALNNVGGWAPWDGSASAVGYASNTRARSGAMSQDIRSTSDSVKTYTPTSGTWTYTAWQFIPTAATGAGTYIILMNKYVSGGAKSWSTQIHFNLSTNKCYDDLTGSVTGSQVAIVRNQWIKIQIDIDLNAGWQTVKYNGSTLFSASWNRSGGVKAFAAVDLYGSSVDHVYYDDLQLAASGAGTSTKVLSWTAVQPTP